MRWSGSRLSAGKQFLQRQVADPFVAEARRQGFICRSAFKLTHIDDTVGLFKGPPLRAVVDLGASPGGWCQVIRQRCGPECAIVGIDLLPVRVSLPGASFIQGDVSTIAGRTALGAAMRGRGMVEGHVDVITSDMCPNRSGSAADRQRIAALNTTALAFALPQLRVGGSFVCKVLGSREGSFATLFDEAKRNFEAVRMIKPPACRQESDESFMVCIGKLAAPRDNNDEAPRVVFDPRRPVGGAGGAQRGVGSFGLDNWPGQRRRR